MYFLFFCFSVWMEAVNISSSLSSTLEEVQKSNVAGVLKFNDVFQSERDDVIFMMVSIFGWE